MKRIGMRRVISVMWDGMRPWAWMFWVASFFNVASVIVFAVIPIQLKGFFDLISSGTEDYGALIWILIVILVAQITRQLFNRIGVYLISVLDSRVITRLMEIAFTYILGHSSHFFENAFSGALVQKVRRLSNAYRNLMESYYFDFLPVAVQVVVAVVVLYWYQPILSVAVFVWVFVFIAINYWFAVWKVKLDIPRSELDTKVTATLADTFSNMPAVITYGQAEYERSKFHEVSDAYSKAIMRSWTVSVYFNGIFSLCIVLLEFYVFYVGVGLWAAGIMSVGTFVLVQIYIIQLAHSLWGFGELIRKGHESVVESLEVVEILDTPHGVADKPGSITLSVTAGVVEFKDVGFAYNETREVIHAANVHIPGGQKVAMIGPSGAGKSTFMRLLLRTYDTTAGSVLIDGTDISTVTQESLRKNIAFVPQDPSLFHRTLMENIRYGRLDATDEEVVEAAVRAHCHEFIKDLPQGYDTLVGERGVKLSGGERQRVAIARAILKNAPILVLDEATSSLDSESESLIQKALDELMKDKTVIVIAHRLSTIRKMDRILVVQDGAIVEDGTHDALLENDSSLYKKLWQLQAGGFIVEG